MSRSIGYHHADWLRLVPTTGPFVTLPVLKEAFQDGLDPVPKESVAALREELGLLHSDPTRRIGFVRWVLSNLLGLEEVRREGPAIPLGLSHPVAEHGVTLRPDAVIVDPGSEAPRGRILITLLDPGLDPLGRIPGERWNATPADRMALLLRATGVLVGVVTDGIQWVLVSTVTPATGTAAWNADLWLEERRTLDAFVSLLGARRLFGVAADQRLEALLERSADAQEEVTGQLGKQVRQAVELLVDAFSTADRRTDGRLLANVSEEEVYGAAVTVMMRLVFMLYAEERRLFPRDDDLYGSAYAASTLLEELTHLEDREGADTLDRRSTAWGRLLGLFRAVHSGVQHEDLRLPAYGGSMFDPDRYPFLEGRPTQETPLPDALPIRVSDLTVKLILAALQVLTFRSGGVTEARRLSFRSLDVEQIGHVYEGLLDHSALRVNSVHVGLSGKLSPEIALVELEERAAKGAEPLKGRLVEITGMTGKQVARALEATTDDNRRRLLRTACEGDDELVERLLPFAEVIRDDARDLPTVFLPGSMYVTKSSERRSSGAYYTPRLLAEEMVVHALEPLVYLPGPQDTNDRSAWRLRSAADILELKVCDMAMGSGAFLVAATRFLADRWIEADDTGERRAVASHVEDEAVVDARRRVVDRCIYGVDRNPMAVEMAKLSLWLITLAKDRPFSFLDHALRPGDSLLGLTTSEQITYFHMDPVRGREIHEGRLFTETAHLAPLLEGVTELRRRIARIPTLTVRDAEDKAALHQEAYERLETLRVVSDLVIGAALSTATQVSVSLDTRLIAAASDLCATLDERGSDPLDGYRFRELADSAAYWLDDGRPPEAPPRTPLHWVLEFPEVFIDRIQPGFDAIIGNPPFLGGVDIAAIHGVPYERFLRTQVPEAKGFIDLAVYFHRRAVAIAAASGVQALLGPSTITATANRRACGDVLLKRGRRIFWAQSRIRWSGTAAVDVCAVAYGPQWNALPELDGTQVSTINATLRASFDLSSLRRLRPWLTYSEGTHLYGSAFVRSENEWTPFVQAEPELTQFLRPYVNAQIMCSMPNFRSDLLAVDFGESERGELISVSRTLASIAEVVARERATQTRQIHERRPWLFWDKRTTAYAGARRLTRVVLVPSLSKHVPVVFANPEYLFSKQVKFILSDDAAVFGLLQSTPFIIWVLATSQVRGGSILFSTSNSLDTFVPPTAIDAVRPIGEEYWVARCNLMQSRQIGVTDLLNLFHDPQARSEDVLTLRRMQRELDDAVLAAYGWTDLTSALQFVTTPLGTRYSLPESIGSALLERLMECNQRAAKAELMSSAGTSRRRVRRGSYAVSMPLLEVAEEPAR